MNERLLYFALVLVIVSVFIGYRIHEGTSRGGNVLEVIGEMKDTEILEILWDASLFVGLLFSIPVLLTSDAPIESLLAVTAIGIIQARRLIESHIL